MYYLDNKPYYYQSENKLTFKKLINKNMVYISTIDTPVTIDIVVYNMLYSRINNGEI